MGGSEIDPNDGPCADCGRVLTHIPDCSLNEPKPTPPTPTQHSKWTGSEIEAEDAPCEVCGGYYFHGEDCDNDPMVKAMRQPKWNLTRPTVVCGTCFGENGHRATCPVRASDTEWLRDSTPPREPSQCPDCGMYMSVAHTDRMCLIRQATRRIRAKKEAFVETMNSACEDCGGITKHNFPCGKAILSGEQNIPLT